MANRDLDSFDDDALDEDPTEVDVRRFDRAEAFCPDCGAEVFDSAEVCPKCYAYLAGNTSSRPPVNSWLRNRMILFVIIVALIGFVLLALRGLFSV
jgi:hypothetical protein